MLCFCTRVAWVCLVCLRLYKEESSSPVSSITERRDMGLYEVPLSMSLLDFGMGTMLVPYAWYYVGIKSSFNMLVRNANARGPMCFRCQIFNLSGFSELLFLLCFISSWT